jgi:hypothetical protein
VAPLEADQLVVPHALRTPYQPVTPEDMQAAAGRDHGHSFEHLPPTTRPAYADAAQLNAAAIPIHAFLAARLRQEQRAALLLPGATAGESQMAVISPTSATAAEATFAVNVPRPPPAAPLAAPAPAPSPLAASAVAAALAAVTTTQPQPQLAGSGGGPPAKPLLSPAELAAQRGELTRLLQVTSVYPPVAPHAPHLPPPLQPPTAHAPLDGAVTPDRVRAFMRQRGLGENAIVALVRLKFSFILPAVNNILVQLKVKPRALSSWLRGAHMPSVVSMAESAQVQASVQEIYTTY